MAIADKLVYGGTEFRLPTGTGADLLEEVSSMDAGTVGTVKTRLDSGGWITITVGPGIPVAVVEGR